MIKKCFWLSSLGLIINLIIPLTAKANSGDIIINEIAWMGTATSANSEWLELYNTTNNDIDLTGWTLAAQDGSPAINLVGVISGRGYFLLERTSDNSVPSITADQIYTGALGNEGENLALKDKLENVIDMIDQNTGWLAGDNITKQTMERTNNSWLNSILPGGTPKNINSLSSNQGGDNTTTPNNNSVGSDTPPNSTNEYLPTNVLINEFVSDPADDEKEWIELYNPTDQLIDLTDWYLEDGGGSKTELIGTLGNNNSDKYLIIYEPKGNLNNVGDIILLKYKNIIVDQVVYGNWDDGNTNDNAPIPNDPKSCARLPNGTDTSNDSIDWQTTTPTPGTANDYLSETDTNIQPSNSIIINELYPNPPLGDLENEFIELTNISNSSVDLNNWEIKDDNGSYVISNKNFINTYLKPKEFLVLYRPTTGLVLNNTVTDKIALRFNNQTIDEVSYTIPAPEGQSWSRSINNEWNWTTDITPGQNNKTKPVVKPPTIFWEIPNNITSGELTVFDASDSFDNQKRSLSFLWDFGDGGKSYNITPSHIYNRSGKYSLMLTLTTPDGGAVTKQANINVKNNNSTSSYQGEILELSEILPNPTGSDEAEWIEIFNPQTEPINLVNWKLKTNDKSYDLPNVDIAAESYYLLNKKQVPFTLLNKGATVNLMSPGSYQDATTYPEAMEGWSWAKINNNWQWTNLPTPQIDNTVNANDYSVPENDNIIELDEVKNLSSRTKVTVQGLVAMKPNSFGPDLFLAGSGLQLTLQQGNWPDLNIGDLIMVNGTVSHTATYGTRLLIKDNTNITVINKNDNIPQATTLNLEELTANYEGWLISITGDIIKIDKNSVTVNDNGQTIPVVFKDTANHESTLTVGQKIQVTGFVVINKGEYKLWPREAIDIIVKESANGRVAGIKDEPINQNTNSNWLGYFFIILAGSIIIIGYWWEKKGKTWWQKRKYQQLN